MRALIDFAEGGRTGRSRWTLITVRTVGCTVCWGLIDPCKVLIDFVRRKKRANSDAIKSGVKTLDARVSLELEADLSAMG
jgi:hypothetical protein